jgi:alpha-beta hydrolase superfamily lysophospholipase
MSAVPAGAATAAAGDVKAFGPVQRIAAGVLDVGYVDIGPPGGRAVLLLHGWPYDIYSYADVAPPLAAAGYRVIVPTSAGTARRGSFPAMRPVTGSSPRWPSMRSR